MQKAKKQDEATIIDLVSNDSRFTRFHEAIKAAGLTERFSSVNHFTVFAPTNEAFARLPQDAVPNLLKPENSQELKKLLLLHTVPGALMTDDLRAMTALKTEAGQEVTVSVSEDLKEIRLGDARVILPQVEAMNGILYPLSAVLKPTAAAAATVAG